MTSEHILTAAVEAAARNIWERTTAGQDWAATWEHASPMAKLALRENVLSVVQATLDAVEPFIRHEAWQEGADAQAAEDARSAANPYSEVL